MKENPLNDVFVIKKNGKKQYYFKKSAMFALPMLSIKHRMTIKTQIATYLYSNMYKNQPNYFYVKITEENDEKLKEKAIAEYENHPWFIKRKGNIYVFTMKEFKEDYNFIKKGLYSKISTQSKLAVQIFWNSFSQEHIKSFLTPSCFHQNYSNILNVDLKLIKQTYELCDKPDKKKEFLKVDNNDES